MMTHHDNLDELHETIKQLRQSIREAAGDLLRGDVNGAYETLKQTVEEADIEDFNAMPCDVLPSRDEIYKRLKARSFVLMNKTQE